MSRPRGQQRSESDASLAAAFDIFGEDSGTTSAATTMHVTDARPIPSRPPPVPYGMAPTRRSSMEMSSASSEELQLYFHFMTTRHVDRAAALARSISSQPNHMSIRQFGAVLVQVATCEEIYILYKYLSHRQYRSGRDALLGQYASMDTKLELQLSQASIGLESGDMGVHHSSPALSSSTTSGGVGGDSSYTTPSWMRDTAPRHSGIGTTTSASATTSGGVGAGVTGAPGRDAPAPAGGALAGGRTPAYPLHMSAGQYSAPRHDSTHSLAGLDAQLQLTSLLSSVRLCVQMRRKLVKLYTTIARGEFPPEYELLRRAASTVCQIHDTMSKPHPFVQPWTAAIRAESVALRYALTAEVCVSRFDFFGTVVALHHATRAFADWRKALARSIVVCRAHDRALAEVSAARSAEAAAQRKKKGAFWSFFTGGSSSSSSLQPPPAWRHRPCQPYRWLRVFCDNLVAKHEMYFGTLLPHLAKRDETAALSGVVVPFGDHSSRTSARSSAVQQQRSLSTASSGGASGAPDGEARGGDASGGGGAASSLGGGAGGGAGARTASSGPLVTAAAAEIREGAAAGGSTRAADEEYATKLASEYDNQRQRYDHRALVRHFVSKCGDVSKRLVHVVLVLNLGLVSSGGTPTSHPLYGYLCPPTMAVAVPQVADGDVDPPASAAAAAAAAVAGGGAGGGAGAVESNAGAVRRVRSAADLSRVASGASTARSTDGGASGGRHRHRRGHRRRRHSRRSAGVSVPPATADGTTTKQRRRAAAAALQASGAAIAASAAASASVAAAGVTPSAGSTGTGSAASKGTSSGGGATSDGGGSAGVSTGTLTRRFRGAVKDDKLDAVAKKKLDEARQGGDGAAAADSDSEGAVRPAAIPRRHGVKQWPAVFAFPDALPWRHWPNLGALLEMLAHARHPMSAKHPLYQYEENLGGRGQATYFIQPVTPALMCCVVFGEKRKRSDPLVSDFLRVFTKQLTNAQVIRMLQS